jgi:transcriptional regulator with XRE-family HTH domain
MAERVKRLREARGLTQPGLAKAAGVSVWLLRRWEQTGRTPLFGTVVKIADALGCTLDELAGRTPPGAPAPRKGKGK